MSRCPFSNYNLYIAKCQGKIVCFLQKLTPAIPFNTLIGASLTISDVVKGLGVFCYNKLYCRMRCDIIIANSANCMANADGLNFTNLQAILVFYNSLVQSILEYNYVEWPPYYSSHIFRIEAAENVFFCRE